MWNFTEFPNKWNKSWGVVVYLIALSAYQTETGKSDTPGQNLYAVHSLLKVYTSAVAKDPKLRDRKYEQIKQMEIDGKLDELLKKDKCTS